MDSVKIKGFYVYDQTGKRIGFCAGRSLTDRIRFLKECTDKDSYSYGTITWGRMKYMEGLEKVWGWNLKVGNIVRYRFKPAIVEVPFTSSEREENETNKGG